MSPSVEPFNEAKYRALMDGLECSEIFYSKVLNTLTVRLDSDYYQKKYLKIEEYIVNNQNQFVSLKSLGLDVAASAFYPSLESYYNKGSIPFIRVADVKNIIDYNNCITLPQMGSDFDTLCLAHKGDIVLTKGGRVGTAGLITKNCYITRDLIFLNSSKLNRSDYITLYLFFCTDFMYHQMLRSSSMTAQPHLTITLIRELLVSVFSEKFKKMLNAFFDDFEKTYKYAKESYEIAEKLLNSIFGLDTFFKSQSSVSIKQLNESFSISGRLDAEYYQPKYANYTDALKTTDTVQTICNLYDKNFIPDEDIEYDYIELANVDIAGNINNVKKVLGKDLPSRARRQVKAGQVIVASVEGSLQSCALIMEEYNHALCSTGFYVLDSDVLNSETLLVLFKSKPIQALLKQRCSGTILTAITKDELLSIPLPQIDVTLQREIAIKVQESFVLRRRSEKLLEYAKRAVEIAIKQDEETAMEWLKGKGIES